MTAKHAIIEIIKVLKDRRLLDFSEERAVYIELDRKEKGAS